ncbi:lysostaphin resistance A-like protein [Planctomycetota bacterium]
MVRIAVFFYGALAAIALVLNAVRGAALFPVAGGPELRPALYLAVACALVTVAFSRFAEGRYEWAREMKRTFRKYLGTLGISEVAAIALLSGVSEELFFRGAVQPALGALFKSDVAGLVVTAVAFACLHIGGRRLVAWTVFAFLLGLVLGWLFLWSQSLLPPIALHVIVNALNLRRITRPGAALEPPLGEASESRSAPAADNHA